MFDVPEFLRKMTECIGDPRLGDVKFVSEFLGLDISKASITGAGRAVFAIANATLASNGERISLAVGSQSPKMLFALLAPPNPRFSASEFDSLGVATKLINSKHSEGVGLELSIGGYACAVIASDANGIIEALECREPKVPRRALPTDGSRP